MSVAAKNLFTLFVVVVNLCSVGLCQPVPCGILPFRLWQKFHNSSWPVRTRAPHPWGGTSWWKTSAPNPGICLWLPFMYLTLICNTVMDWVLPVDTQVPFFPATKTKLTSEGITTVSPLILSFKSCLQRGERDQRELPQHSVQILDFPPLRHGRAERKQHKTSPPSKAINDFSCSLSGSLQKALCYKYSWAWEHITGHILYTWSINKTKPFCDGLFDSTQGHGGPLGAKPASRAGAGQGDVVWLQGKGQIANFHKIKEELVYLLRAK